MHCAASSSRTSVLHFGQARISSNSLSIILFLLVAGRCRPGSSIGIARRADTTSAVKRLSRRADLAVVRGRFDA